MILTPTDSPTTSPTSDSVTHTQLLSPAMHAAMTKKHLRCHKNKRFPHSHSKHEGCSGCQADAKNALNTVSTKHINDKTISEDTMQYNANHPHNTVKKEVYITYHTARKPHIVKPDSNIKVKSSNTIDPIHNKSPDLSHTDHVDYQYEAEKDQYFLSSFKCISDDEHQSDDDKIPDPAMKGAAIPSQLFAQIYHLFMNSFQDFNQFTA
eukprot:2886099-Ditylum_brightwellii.AAC.1